MDVTAIKEPRTGLEGKFSVYHAAAVAVVEGAAGEAQFSEEAVHADAVARLRARVVATIDPGIGKAQAQVAILLTSGERLAVFVEHTVGSVENPLSDGMLDDKFRGLAAGILSPGRTERLIELCRSAQTLADAGEIARNAASG
jgi:2-methylcitrate dehydratase PrpD